jgi:ATP/maltotriose-dependent transcriptional regulator MalT
MRSDVRSYYGFERLRSRERAVRDLIKKRQKPIALFIDDAHDVPTKTLTELKRLLHRQPFSVFATLLKASFTERMIQ